MMFRRIPHILLLILCITVFSHSAGAQFRSEAFTQSYNDDKDSPADSIDTMWSFKEYFGGLAHKNDLKIGSMFAGSLVFVGGEQIYNRQYWKLPVIYGGIGAGIGLGIHYGKQGNKTASTLSYVGAGLVYWGALMDGIICYNREAPYPQPGRATIYSILVPGLGQAYNHEYWKIPIYVGGMATAAYFYATNKTGFDHYRDIYNQATDPAGGYDGPISAETALYYRDVYRRYRDYSLLALCAVYLLQVIDANVFAYMHDFNVTDDITMSVSPTYIAPDSQYAFNPTPQPYGTVGLGLSLKF